MKRVVTISRKWNRPEITTTVTGDGILVEIGFDDFCNAVKAEIDSVTWVFTKVEFYRRFNEAVAKVLEDVKKESGKVV